jgi:hypothetical protein
MANNYLYDEQTIVGKTVKSIVNSNNEELLINFTNGGSCRFYHYQNCRGSIYIKESDDLNLLEGATLTSVTKEIEDGSDDHDSITITTYTFEYSEGIVKVIWKGVSNGYYSEEVDFEYFLFGRGRL